MLTVAAWQAYVEKLANEALDRIERRIGTDDQRNRALACPDCNLVKGPNLTSLDPATGKIVALFNPRRQKWRTHFAFQGTRIMGKTAVGRASVSLLSLNNAERLRVRALLFG